jgi:hypothetical protein
MFMETTILDPGHVIHQMITLRLQLAELEQQIDSLKPAFFAACAAQDVSQFKHEQAVISRRLTPGKWNYSGDILEQEQHLKQLKQRFQQTHEPVAGRDITWSIQLTPQL